MQRLKRNENHQAARDIRMEALLGRVLKDCVCNRRKANTDHHSRQPALPRDHGDLQPIIGRPDRKAGVLDTKDERQTETLLIGIGLMAGFSIAQLLLNWL